MLTIYLWIDAASGFLVMALPAVVLQCCYQLRSRGKSVKKSGWHIAGCWIFLFLLAGILAITGVPSLNHLDPDYEMNLVPFDSFHNNRIQYYLNIMLFVPYGFLLPLLFQRYRSFIRTAVSGLLLSFAIEFSQLFNIRATDIDDLFMNTLGAVLGWVICAAVRRIFSKTSKRFLSAEKGEALWLTLIAWIVMLTLQSYVSSFFTNIYLS